MQIKTMRYHFLPRRVIIKQQTITHAGEDPRNWNSFHMAHRMQNDVALWRMFWLLSLKVGQHLHVFQHFHSKVHIRNNCNSYFIPHIHLEQDYL